MIWMLWSRTGTNVTHQRMNRIIQYRTCELNQHMYCIHSSPPRHEKKPEWRIYFSFSFFPGTHSTTLDRSLYVHYLVHTVMSCLCICMCTCVCIIFLLCYEEQDCWTVEGKNAWIESCLCCGKQRERKRENREHRSNYQAVGSLIGHRIFLICERDVGRQTR